MRLVVFLSTLLVIALSLGVRAEDQSCQDSYAALIAQVAALPPRLNVTAKAYSQKVFDCVRKVPTTLDSCHLPEVKKQFDYYLPTKCINQLQDVTTLVDLIDRDTNNVTKSLHILQLTAHVSVQMPLKCPNLMALINTIINMTKPAEDFTITPPCEQGVYQYSLLIQKVVQDISTRSQKLPTDVVAAVNGLPTLLDECNQPALANKIRLQFPKQCLQSIDHLTTVVSDFVFNHAHLEWMWAHKKELVKAFSQMRYTCPAI